MLTISSDLSLSKNVTRGVGLSRITDCTLVNTSFRVL